MYFLFIYLWVVLNGSKLFLTTLFTHIWLRFIKLFVKYDLIFLSKIVEVFDHSDLVEFVSMATGEISLCPWGVGDHGFPCIDRDYFRSTINHS